MSECQKTTKRTKIAVKGIVRHYHVRDSENLPYRGILTEENDTKASNHTLENLLSGFKDGDAVTITIESSGEHPSAKNHRWVLTKPHIYERVRNEALK